MTLAEQLQQEIAALPEREQGLVAEFVAFLRHRQGGMALATGLEPVVEAQDLASILEQLAEANPFHLVANPVTWQQEQRTDRALPLRDL